MTPPTGDPESGTDSSPAGDQLVPPSEPGPVAPATTTDGTAIVALVCAVLSWIALPVVLAIVALVLAGRAERTIETSGGLTSGTGLVAAAKWVAWINLLVVAMVVAFVAAFLIAVAVGR